MSTLCYPVVIMLAAAPVTRQATPWNEAEIRWQSYDDGLRVAKRTGQPVCLVLYTTWCKYCSAYSQVFRDPEIVKLAKDFVMVRVDADASEALSGRYNVDGEYIPRTFFLSAEGKVDPSLRAKESGSRYVYDTKDPRGLAAGMRRALAKLKR